MPIPMLSDTDIILIDIYIIMCNLFVLKIVTEVNVLMLMSC